MCGRDEPPSSNSADPARLGGLEEVLSLPEWLVRLPPTSTLSGKGPWELRWENAAAKDKGAQHTAARGCGQVAAVGFSSVPLQTTGRHCGEAQGIVRKRLSPVGLREAAAVKGGVWGLEAQLESKQLPQKSCCLCYYLQNSIRRVGHGKEGETKPASLTASPTISPGCSLCIDGGP